MVWNVDLGEIRCLTRWGGAVRLLGGSFGGAFDGRRGEIFGGMAAVGLYPKAPVYAAPSVWRRVLEEVNARV